MLNATQITRDEFNAAMTDYDGLSEILEMRLRQRYVIEALLLEVPGQESHIWVACYDLNDGDPRGYTGLDFSVHDDLREHCKTCAATFYKTIDMGAFRMWVTEMIANETQDETI